jgi:putative membrane protein
MLVSAVVAYLHYLGLMLSFGALVLEIFILNSQKELSLNDAWKIVIADTVYGISAVMILATGVLRVIYYGKGSEYYLNNPVFYTKVAIFLLVGGLSLYPTVSFISWVPALQKGTAPKVESTQVNRLIWLIRTEIVGFALIPLLAALMARGIGYPMR